MRNILNISITEMVYREGYNKTIFDDSCPAPGGGVVAEREGFLWSENLQGIIIGAFYWGYVRQLTHKIINDLTNYFCRHSLTFQAVCYHRDMAESTRLA